MGRSNSIEQYTTTVKDRLGSVPCRGKLLGRRLGKGEDKTDLAGCDHLCHIVSFLLPFTSSYPELSSSYSL